MTNNNIPHYDKDLPTRIEFGNRYISILPMNVILNLPDDEFFDFYESDNVGLGSFKQMKDDEKIVNIHLKLILNDLHTEYIKRNRLKHLGITFINKESDE